MSLYTIAIRSSFRQTCRPHVAIWNATFRPTTCNTERTQKGDIKSLINSHLAYVFTPTDRPHCRQPCPCRHPLRPNFVTLLPRRYFEAALIATTADQLAIICSIIAIGDLDSQIGIKTSQFAKPAEALTCGKLSAQIAGVLLIIFLCIETIA